MTIKQLYDMTDVEIEREIERRAENAFIADPLYENTGKPLQHFTDTARTQVSKELQHQESVIDYWGDWIEETDDQRSEREFEQLHESLMEDITDPDMPQIVVDSRKRQMQELLNEY